MRDGIDDDTYERCFKPIIDKVIESFRPSAIVLQCGADSLTGDRLGCFNLTLKVSMGFFLFSRKKADFLRSIL